jgi:hypothetical protein
MKKTRFRIIRYNNGDADFYETKVKTWFGWISFSVFYKAHIIHVIDDPFIQKSLAIDRINQYCKLKGYKKKDIVITEINKSKPKKWIFFQRVYPND